jgi:polyphosphate kinase 2 (PPK2 family)
VSALEAQQVRVVPVGAPTEEERAQPYLWRFWRHLPPRGHVLVFDRSWYGRVLVERVEGYARASEWTRAYAEINDFEEQMTRHGTVLAKFWLQVGKAEQLRRFQEREDVAYKRYKLTPEDWRNRKRWAAYQQAMADMVDRTSTEIAPWTLVPANDKKYARVRVLGSLCDRIEDSIG